MVHRYLQIASTPSVRDARGRFGGAEQYARHEGTSAADDVATHERLGDAEAAFIADRDGFYLASVSETGWPYVQFRGGPPGFLRVLDERTLAFADFRGNRQYITTGNTAANQRVSLFLMDYPNRRRLKLFGHATVTAVDGDAELAARVALPDYRARVERVVKIHVAAFDWNCPQHITPRFTQIELDGVPGPVRERMAVIEAENASLRLALTTARKERP